MKISTQHVSRYITRFENAVRVHEMKGAQHPEDHEQIERDYQRAKATLRQFMIESIVGEG